MKRKALFWSTLIIIVIFFLLYLYSFTTTNASNLYLTVDYENNNGWEISGVENGEEKSLTATQAIDYTKTVFLRRTILENWASYSKIYIDTGRAVLVFVDESLVFSNYQTDLSVPGELPRMQKPQNQPFSLVFSFNPSWVGKTITVVTRVYDNEPYGSIGFELVSDDVLLFQHGAWVNQHALPGAIYGIISVLLFGLFLFQLSTSKKGFPILLLVFASLLQMFCYMSVLNENPLPMIDSGLATAFYFLFPLLYLGTKMTNLRKMYFITILSVWSIYFILYTATFVLHLPLPYWFDKVELLCFILLGIMLYYCLKERRTNTFLRYFLSLLVVFLAGYTMLFFASAALNKPLNKYMIIIFKEAFRLYCRPLLFWVFTTILFALFILAVWEVLQDRIWVAKQLERMKSEQAMLDLQIEAAKEQLNVLRTANEQTVIYRHDMRHHLSLLSGFAMDGDMQKIKEYLVAAESDINAVTPVRYSENETVNLILSSFEAKANKVGVSLCAKVQLPAVLEVNDTEICSLLSNGLENAITAAAKLQDETLRKVDIRVFVKDGKLLISIKNAYAGTLEMEGKFPKTQNREEGHGFGIKSMIAIVERYGGLHSFKTVDGVFVIQLVLPIIQRSKVSLAVNEP